jgi:hypothetical protein
VETRDGRVLLLTNEALVRVEVEAVGGKPVVRAVQRWAWGALRNRFDWRFVDADNGLWLEAGPSLYDRYTLPAAAANEARATIGRRPCAVVLGWS